jgi:hypothetical protein
VIMSILFPVFSATPLAFGCDLLVSFHTVQPAVLHENPVSSVPVFLLLVLFQCLVSSIRKMLTLSFSEIECHEY